MTLTSNKGYTLPVVGGDFGIWGSELNGDLGIIDLNLGGVVSVDVTGHSSITATTAQAQNLIHNLVGTISANIAYILPPTSGIYIINNNASGAFNIVVGTSALNANTMLLVPGKRSAIYSDGVNVAPFMTTFSEPLTLLGFTTSGNAIFNAPSTFNTLGTFNNGVVANTIQVNGPATVNGQLNAITGVLSGNLSAASATVTGNMTAASATVTGTATAATSSCQTLNVSSNAQITGNENITGALAVGQGITNSGNSQFNGGTNNFAGNVNIGGAVSANGIAATNINASGSLGVGTGITNNGNAQFNGGTNNFTGNVNIGGALGLTGALTVASNAQFNSNFVQFANSAAIANNLDVFSLGAQEIFVANGVFCNGIFPGGSTAPGYELWGNGTGSVIEFRGDGWELFWSNASGALSFIRPDGTALWTADGSGNTFQPGAVSSSNVSDERTKKNILPYERSLADLVQLEPVSYQYNGLGLTSDDGRVRFGLTAQAAQPYIPECVEPTVKLSETGLLDGQLSLHPEALIFALINAVKELSARVSVLDGQSPKPSTYTPPTQTPYPSMAPQPIRRDK